jgi:hypothetical protein
VYAAGVLTSRRALLSCKLSWNYSRKKRQRNVAKKNQKLDSEINAPASVPIPIILHAGSNRRDRRARARGYKVKISRKPNYPYVGHHGNKAKEESDGA